jgi:hypothetical protein
MSPASALDAILLMLRIAQASILNALLLEVSMDEEEKERARKIGEEIHETALSGFRKAMEAEGITADVLAKQLKEELNANETKFFSHEGEVVDEREVIAWRIRQEARKDGNKLRGDYPADQLNLGGNIVIERRIIGGLKADAEK